MEKQSDTKEIFQIKRVKEKSFSIKEDLYNKDSSQRIKVKLSFKLDMNPEENLMRFLLTVYLHYEGSTEILAENTLENVFYSSNLQNHIKEGFPTTNLLTIISDSIAHARALLSKNIAGTVYDQTIVPLIKAEAVANQFFNQDVTNKEIIVLPLEETPEAKAKTKKKKAQ